MTTATRTHDNKILEEPAKKKAARFPERPFLSYGSLTLNGRSQDVVIRGPISRLILIGSRCSSGQSRTVARSVAVVSHLRKMTLVSHRFTRGATAASSMSPLIPLFTGAWAAHNNTFCLGTAAQQRPNNPIEFRK